MKRAYLAERRKEEAERESAKEKPETRSAAEIDLALRAENTKLREDLAAERERDEAAERCSGEGSARDGAGTQRESGAGRGRRGTSAICGPAGCSV